MDSKTSVVLTAVENLDRADVLCAVLRDCGFDAYVVDGNTAGMLWHITQAISPQGIRIAVPADQADEAWKAIQELEQEAHELRTSPHANGPERDGREFFRPDEVVGSTDYCAKRAGLCSLF